MWHIPNRASRSAEEIRAIYELYSIVKDFGEYRDTLLSSWRVSNAVVTTDLDPERDLGAMDPNDPAIVRVVNKVAGCKRLGVLGLHQYRRTFFGLRRPSVDGRTVEVYVDMDARRILFSDEGTYLAY